MATDFHVQPGDALLVIDMQEDFLPGGRLPVPEGDAVIPGINRIAPRFAHIILTSDWHPENHVSFASAHPGRHPLKDSFEGPYGPEPLWPDHCVQGTPGAALTPKLSLPRRDLLLYKGTHPGREGLSAFLEGQEQVSTGLEGYLRGRGVERVFLCGLAFEVCVGFSAIDAARAGFAALILEDLTRPANIPEMLSEVSRGFARHDVRLCSSHSLR